MSTGHEDYWYKYLTSHNIMGPEQSPWFAQGTKEVNPGVIATFITYNVPEGYKLNITGGIISADLPGVNAVFFYVDDVLLWRLYFDLNIQLHFNPAAGHILAAEQTLKLLVLCADADVKVLFEGALFGFEEKI